VRHGDREGGEGKDSAGRRRELHLSSHRVVEEERVWPAREQRGKLGQGKEREVRRSLPIPRSERVLLPVAYRLAPFGPPVSRETKKNETGAPRRGKRVGNHLYNLQGPMEKGGREVFEYH